MRSFNFKEIDGNRTRVEKTIFVIGQNRKRKKGKKSMKISHFAAVNFGIFWVKVNNSVWPNMSAVHLHSTRKIVIIIEKNVGKLKKKTKYNILFTHTLTSQTGDSNFIWCIFVKWNIHAHEWTHERKKKEWAKKRTRKYMKWITASWIDYYYFKRNWGGKLQCGYYVNGHSVEFQQ